MSDMSDKKWRELTLSQREGKAPLPESLQIGQLTIKFRNKVWRVLSDSLRNCIYKNDIGGYWYRGTNGKYWSDFIRSYHFNILEKPHDVIEADPISVMRWLRALILKGGFYEVLSLLEQMLRYRGIPDSLEHNINQCLELAPCFIDQSYEPVCIVPTTSEAMKKVVEKSLENINASGLDGAKKHLSNSAEALNNNDYADSMRESIHAIESAVKQISPKNSNSFSSALNSLEEVGIIKHRALKAVFKNLYGYTSDEKGIRHALIEKDAADVELEEAMFMYTACVASVDFLVSKQRRMKEK